MANLSGQGDFQYGLDYHGAVAITPSDSVDFATGACRAIYIGGAGNVTLVDTDGDAVLFTAPPVGSILPVRATRVNATGTTATALVALY